MTIKLNAATGGGSVSLGAPNSTTSNLDVELTLPVDDGTSGQVLQTNGSGTLSFADASSDNITEGNTTVECVDTGSNGHITFDTEGSERMRIDSSGRVGIGTTSPGSFNGDMDDLVVGSGSGSKGIAIYSGTSSTGNVLFHDTANTSISGMLRYDHSTNTMSFWTNGATERMKINNAGQMHSYSINSVHYFYSGAGATGSDYFIQAHYGATGYNGTESFRVTTNGNVSNTNNSYGSLSDIKLKENIVDANSQWDDLKALQVRNYNFKEGQTHTQIGVIAQEVELVSPGLVSESRDLDGDGNDLGTVTKYVNYSVLYMKAVKALQEAMTRIEALETANASLEARLTALEGGAA